MRRSFWLVSAAAVVTLGLVPTEADGCNRILPIDGHAESLYADFSVGSDREIRFNQRVVSAGSAAERRGTPFDKAIDVPDFVRVRAGSRGCTTRHRHRHPEVVTEVAVGDAGRRRTPAAA